MHEFCHLQRTTCFSAKFYVGIHIDIHNEHDEVFCRIILLTVAML